MASVRAQIEEKITAAIAALPDVFKVYDDPSQMLDELGEAQGLRKHLAIVAYDQDDRVEGGTDIEAFRFNVFVMFGLYVPDGTHPRDVADPLLVALYEVYSDDPQWGELALATEITSFSSGLFMEDSLAKAVCVVQEFRVSYRFSYQHAEVPR